MGSSQSSVVAEHGQQSLQQQQQNGGSSSSFNKKESNKKTNIADTAEKVGANDVSHDDISSSSTSHSKKKKDDENNLSGMELVNYVCRKRKYVYEKCVSNWYTNEFLTGKSINQEEFCDDKFQLYRRCVLKGIRKEVWDNQLHLPPPEPNSPLSEIMEDE